MGQPEPNEARRFGAAVILEVIVSAGAVRSKVVEQLEAREIWQSLLLVVSHE